jgi:hypothetical protein
MSRLLVLWLAVTVGGLSGCARLAVNQTGLVYYVAVDGDDANSGGRGAPFASLERSREAVRAVLRAGVLPVGGVTVCVRGGRYFRSAGFVLSARDSGVDGRPVVYRAFPGESVRLIGGVEIPRAAFRAAPHGAVAGTGEVQCVNLRAFEFAGSAALLGPDAATPDGLELCFGKQLLQRVSSLPEALAVPGRWYVDRETGLLHVWPPATLAVAPLVFATLTDPMVTLEQTAFVTWQGFTMEATRGAAVAVRGGHDNRIAACTIRNTGATGIAVTGLRNGVSGCDLEDTGGAAITLDGGDRLTLQAAGNYADNNTVRGCPRRQRDGVAAIHLDGVGNRVTHNLIYDLPGAAILYAGNDHLIEANEILRACLETAARGALHSGRDWATQGTLIRGNFIHDIGGAEGMASGVALDDCASGNTVERNVFYRAGAAVALGGGRYNRLINNLFVDCAPAVRVDDRGRQRIRWQAGPQESWDLQAKLEAMNYRQPPWSDRYPYLTSILDDQPELPLHNTMLRNVAVGGRWLEATEETAARLEQRDNLVTATDPGFVARRRLDLRLRDDALVWTAVPGFEPLPLETVGVYRDPWRASWPVRRPAVVDRAHAPGG